MLENLMAARPEWRGLQQDCRAQVWTPDARQMIGRT
jgi:hypothetical protein